MYKVKQLPHRTSSPPSQACDYSYSPALTRQPIKTGEKETENFINRTDTSESFQQEQSELECQMVLDHGAMLVKHLLNLDSSDKTVVLLSEMLISTQRGELHQIQHP